MITIALYNEIQRKLHILGVSTNVIDSKKIKLNIDSKLKYFYEPIPNSIDVETKSWLTHKVRYMINSDALNERFEYKIHKDSRVFRIIAIGDSFTYGLHVSTVNNFVELLEDILNQHYLCKKVNKYEVINLGMEGYDTQYEVERYRIRGKKYNPDLVIWYIDDLYRLTGKIREIQMTIPTKVSADKTMNNFFGSWEIAYKKVQDLYSEEQLFDFQIEKIKEFRDQHYDGPLLIIAKEQYLNLFKKKLIDKNIHYGLPGNVEKESEYLLPDLHFNEKGHKQMSEEILMEMEDEKLIPCGPTQ